MIDLSEHSNKTLMYDILYSLKEITVISSRLTEKGLNNFAILLELASQNVVSLGPDSEEFLDEIGRSCKLIKEIEYKLTEAGLTDLANDLKKERDFISKTSHSLMIDTQRIFLGDIFPEKN